jgi:hypothetical protein
MEWQPIETAPRDGTHILGYADGEMAAVYCLPTWYDDGWSLSVSGKPASDSYFWPTHWMPLPKPPETKE